MSVTANGVYASNGSVLPEERLKQISKSSRTLIPNETSATNTINDFNDLLDHVFATSSAPGLSAPHRVAAWNTLCCLIDQYLVSSCPDLQQPRRINQVWDRAFDLYLKHAQSAKPKSSKQLLATLTTVLRLKEGPEIDYLKETALLRLVHCLTDYQAPHAAKAGAQLLGQLLHKNIATLKDVLDPFPGRPDHEMRDLNLDEKFCCFLEALFKWLSSGDFGSSISQLVAIVLDKFRQDGTFAQIGPGSEDQRQPIWVAPLQNTLTKGSVSIDDLRAHILPVLFKRSFADFVSFLKAQGFWSTEAALSGGARLARAEAQEDLLFATLQTGKELGLVVETDENDFSQPFQPIRIPIRWMGELLIQRSRSARLTGLSLLTTSHSATRPLSNKALMHIKRAFRSMFADVDADFRSGVFSAFQRLIDRLRAITAVLARRKHNDESANNRTAMCEVSHSLQAHKDFLHWALRFINWELRPTASYQRHISALKCFTILARSGLDGTIPPAVWSRTAQGESKWPFTITVLTNGLQRLLLDLAIDPFDDVRQAAIAILDLQDSVSLELGDALRRAEADMLRTGRADHADGVARIYALRFSTSQSCSTTEFEMRIVHDLVGQLEKMLEIARQSLLEAVNRYPLHGILISLRYVLVRDDTAPIAIRERLLRLLGDVWHVVKPVLCNDAPEGYALEEQDELNDSTKETLSYCWRALKEASLLLSALVAVQSSNREPADRDLTQRLSNLCFTQLVELRHRGAVSTVAQSWVSCCTQCRYMKIDGDLLLDTWYLKVLDMLRRNVTINTRRSAGLPSLLCGILIADSSHILLSRAVADLEAISRQDVDPVAAEEGSLAQVHAMNCLKDILKNSRLGEQSEPYIAVAFQLAVDSLRSEVWAIRNCGLMLFRAVVDRILKTDQSHFDDDFRSGRTIPIEQYPALLDTVFKLLPQSGSKIAGSDTRYEGVFAALQLLQHIKIPRARFGEIIQTLRPLTSSTSWHMRDKAARTWTSVMLNMGLVAGITGVQELLCQTYGDDCDTARDANQNYVHGILLRAKYVIRMAALRCEKCTLEGIRVEADCKPHRSGTCRAIFGGCRGHLRWLAVRHPVVQAALIDLMRELTHTLLELCGRGKEERLDVQREIFDLWSTEDLASPTAATVFQTLLSQCLSDPSAAVMRQATARFMAQQIPLIDLANEGHIAACVRQVVQLAHTDADACKDFLRALRAEQTNFDTAMALFATQMCQSIVKIFPDMELQCEALDVLLSIHAGPHHEALDAEILFTSSRDYLSTQGCNRRYADLGLEYRAVQLERNSVISSSAELEVDIRSWVSDCARAISGHGAHTREAATNALGRSRHLWRTLQSTPGLQSSLLNIIIAVYDLLNDDDEEIRLSAARITQRILSVGLSASETEHEPITASQELLAFCTKRWNTSQELSTKALQRAFDWPANELPLPVTEHLQLASRTDTALFAEEKQNLYIDDAKEVRTWSQVLTHLSPSAISKQKITTLATWVETGFDALQAHAENNPDGPLGWSSDADTFTMGLRVVYGAEVLLGLARREVHLPTRPSQLRRRLCEYSLELERSGVNSLWRWEIQRILAGSVLHKVQMVGSLARDVAQA